MSNRFQVFICSVIIITPIVQIIPKLERPECPSRSKIKLKISNERNLAMLSAVFF